MSASDDTTNPLLDLSGPTRYASVRPEHMVPAIRRATEDAAALRARLVAAEGPATWRGVVDPIDDAEERVERAWNAISNLDATIGSDAIRAAHREAQEIVTVFGARREQDERLYRAFREVAEGPAKGALDPTQRKVLADAIRDFRLAGVDLPPERKERVRAIQTELAALGSEFADHVTDDTKEFRLVVDRPQDVEGLPPNVVGAARARALADDPSAPPERWAFTLDQPSVMPFLAYQRDRELRARLHRAYVTRATAGERDNAPLIRRILVLRGELASLLGFASYAELSLAPKMARSPAEVREFLRGLAQRALPRAREEVAEIAEEARRADGIERLERSDLGFYAERVRLSRHGFSQEDLRPYFPLPRVLEGLGQVMQRLYGIRIDDRTGSADVETWHPDVRVLEVREADAVLGHVLFDPYARPGKRAGAWVSGAVSRKRRRDGSLQRPLAHLVCNFPAPVGGRPSQLSHGEVRTLFHETGHALHHLLTEVDHRAAAGISGVPWDGVEFPSQFHENWIWNAEALALVSGHVDTGEPLPREMLDRLLGARRFLAGVDLLRQVELALVDLELHAGFDPEAGSVRDVVADVRRLTGVVPDCPEERFENSFLHVFTGGYAAGYYGYKWAEVLAADAFGRFEEEGIFAPAAARAFRASVLARGGSEDFLGLFVRFRGREPDPAALLRQAGIF